MKAKKQFGQHFLVKERYANRLASLLADRDDFEQIIEVGPGQGVLTRGLLELGKPLIAIELDRDLIPILREKFPDLHIIQGDFLKEDLHAILNDRQTALVGNYPYNISSQIVIKTVSFRHLIPLMVGMFQFELGQRICSDPGSKQYGAISVIAQAFYNLRLFSKIPPGAFSPPPKVHSAIVKMERNNIDLPCDLNLFMRIVKSSFSQRRKMLRNSLKSIVPSNEVLQADFFSQRPEQLAVEDFIHLTNTLQPWILLQD